MVMEAATLSGPQRKCNVVPVQKSLSLPSYARAGGEGIDHRLIFAALEQKERVRRKSKIFTKEKTSRQNIFCLPISTGSKCRETDLSSDTSCSSLEYQKPKPSAKPKKEDSKQVTKINENETKSNELKSAKTSTQFIIKKANTSKQIDSKSNADYGVLTKNIINGGGSFQVNEHSKGHRSPVDTLRPNVGSSDSMDRSSRSSNDSLTRKERLVAIKARVEAEREKYGNSSSDDETRTNLTRYNSDGGIHRTVRDVKTRSYRNEKRLRRRSHGEWAVKKADRKNNLSLCLNPEDDGIKLHLEKLNRLNNEINNLEVKTDYCPSPNVPDTAKKYYFSDFPSKENVTRFVQQRIRRIEEEEHKRRSGSDFFDKMKLSQFSSFSQEKSTSIEHVNLCEKKTLVSNLISDSRHGSSEFGQRASPTQRGKEAPTPPPRSPKSISIMNKTFLQHQNVAHSQLESDFVKKNAIQVNNFSCTQTKPSEKSPKSEVKFRNPKNSLQTQNNSTESRELFNSRRKTCSNFDFVDEKVLNDLCSVLGTAGSSNLTTSSNHSCSLNQIKSIDNKDCSSNPDVCPLVPTRNENKSLVNKFEENERRREFMFNSLENKKSSSSLSWAKWKVPFGKEDVCICYLSPGNKLICKSKQHVSTHEGNSTENFSSHDDFKNLESKILFNGSHERRKMLSDNKNTSYLTAKNKIEYNSNHQKEKDKIDEDLAIQLQDLENNLKMADKNKSTALRNVSSNVINSTKIDGFRSEDRYVNEKIYFNTGQSKEDINCPANNSSATANLDSAMAELENVYMSLKLSSDNLSERNSLSNVSLSEEDSKLFTKKPANLPNKDVPTKRLSIHESNTYFDDVCGRDINSNMPSLFPKDENSADTANIKEVNKHEHLKDNSINELFKDLMPQLNTLEEKLRSHDSRYPQPINCQRLNKLDNKSSDNCTSSIRFKKEFYENLHLQHGNFQRKKLAAQKLSENITNLMNSPTSQSKSGYLPESRSNLVITKSANNSPSNSYKSIKIDPWENKSNVSETPYFTRQSIKTNESIKPFNPRQEEIRHIRVSMDSTTIDSYPEVSKYSRLSSAVNSPHMSPKCDVAKPFTFAPSTCDSVDKTIDGLEELLNSLLVDVPDNKQSSLPKTKEPVSTTSPIAAVCRENVKVNSYFLPPKMDTMCIASKSKNEVSSSGSGLRNVNSEEKAQKENADFRQNNNAHLNRVSFIPVYNTKKADSMCHYYSDKGDESKKSSLLHGDQNKLKTTNSSSGKQNYLAEQNEKLSLRSLRTHMRRRSVGFEDMTSMNACYISNEKRNETVIKNSNKTSVPDTACGKVLNSDNDINFDHERTNQKELSHISLYNENAKVMKNANDQTPETDRPYQHYKDKSSKRKSSLNRMDFIDFPPAYNGKSQYRKSSYRSKDSSSEDELDSKPRQNFETNHSKRKHNIVPVNGVLSSQQKPSSEVLQSTPPFTKARLLPKSLNSPHPKFRQHKKAHSATLQLQKLSHSAGELESLTDESNATNKVCLSAQEFDSRDSSGFSSRLKTLAGSKNKKYASQLPPVNRSSSPLKNSDASQHQSIILNSDKNCSSTENICRTNAQKTILSSEEKATENENDCSSALMATEPILSCMNLNDSFELKHIDSKSEDDLEVADSTIQLLNLNISEDKGLENGARVSDDNCDSVGSDGERRPSSILRKKYAEEKKELHSILKPPPEDKSSKTLPSILKHRESSEEKDLWQQSDLHSILKKSTSEDESCNSGPDIRPILKVSTDEDSPGGGGSSKPRPILKKRTSFSEECCYASYPNGELKPILKKKTLLLLNEDQPRPILKSRRKSEDARSSLSEFVASRPRAYSADMGVKPNLDRQDDVDQKSDDFCKRESQHL